MREARKIPQNTRAKQVRNVRRHGCSGIFVGDPKGGGGSCSRSKKKKLKRNVREEVKVNTVLEVLFCMSGIN